MKISDETKVGILAAFGLAILIIGYSFLKGNNVFHKKFVLYAVYDNVDGLNQSDLVKRNGMTIGRVNKLSFLSPQSGKIVAEIYLNEGVVISRQAVAKIASADLMGTKIIAITSDSIGAPAVSGDTLKTEASYGLMEQVTREILPVKQKAEQLMGSIDSVVQVVQALLKGGAVEGSINNLNRATGGVASIVANVDTLIKNERSSIHNILTNLDSITGNFKNSNGQVTNIVNNLSTLSDSLSRVSIAATVKSMDSTLVQLNQVLKKVNEGGGTAGKLINDPVLYNNLAKASASLDTLLVDLQQHPERYVHLSMFGRKSDSNSKK